MSRRNNDAITIHSILDWIEDNLESLCHWKKCQNVQVTPNGTCNGCLKKKLATLWANISVAAK